MSIDATEPRAQRVWPNPPAHLPSHELTAVALVNWGAVEDHQAAEHWLAGPFLEVLEEVLVGHELRRLEHDEPATGDAMIRLFRDGQFLGSMMLAAAPL